ncbi:MAG: hypothetical protein CVU52_03240 [Deltaproteobacteria bacterium HGW-Deltaproteobacteria-10]|nr:MAG: hypothetical protein CVU52_03240 [Deltaproteobacteria bacterium HGW-Deltaproteobacteria-10]
MIKQTGQILVHVDKTLDFSACSRIVDEDFFVILEGHDREEGGQAREWRDNEEIEQGAAAPCSKISYFFLAAFAFTSCLIL